MAKASTPDLTSITHGPSGVRLEKPLILTPDHPAALTFCILGSLTDPVVLTSPCPHLLIYHGLQKCVAEPDSRRWKIHLKDYQTKIVHGRLTRERLQAFQRDSDAAHLLRITGMGEFSVLSLWQDPKRPLGLDSLERIGQLLGVQAPHVGFRKTALPLDDKTVIFHGGPPAP